MTDDEMITECARGCGTFCEGEYCSESCRESQENREMRL